jgi:hypothetical protein
MPKPKNFGFGATSKTGMSKPLRICDMSPEDAKKATKAILDKEEKVMIILEKNSNDEEGAALTFSINGYPYTITRGKPVNVPNSIAELVKNNNDGVDFEAVLKDTGIELIKSNK